MFRIAKGISCKVIKQIDGKLVSVSTKQTTKELIFAKSITSEQVINEMAKMYKLSFRGGIVPSTELIQYAIFSNGSGGDRHEKYFIAVPYWVVEII